MQEQEADIPTAQGGRPDQNYLLPQHGTEDAKQCALLPGAFTGDPTFFTQ